MDTTSDWICRRRRRPTINIVPLVDVLTVLLFFFLVTMQFKQVSTLNITVPKIETAGKNEIEERIVIAVSPEGEFYTNRDHWILTRSKPTRGLKSVEWSVVYFS